MTPSLEILATASRFAIALAIVYFAWQLAQINDNVSTVTESVDKVTQQIPPTLEEVKQIRLEVAEIRQQIPAILAEVEAVRGTVPAVLAEVAAVRGEIPPVLNRIERVQQEIPAILERVDALNRQIDPVLKQLDETTAVVDRTQKQIPDMLATADRAIQSVDSTREQVVPLVPQALDEIRQTRESVDPTLDRVETIIDEAYVKAQESIALAQEAGQEASEGAVKGFFTGILKLPFDLVGTLASPIVKNIDPDVAKQLTEKDVELMAEAGKKAAEGKKTGRVARWENPNSDNSGSITVERRYQRDGFDCVDARIVINKKRRKILDKIDEFCLDEEGKWASAGEVQQ